MIRPLRSLAVGRRALALRRVERREVAAARQRFGGRPAASVAVVVATSGPSLGVGRAVASVLAQTHRDLVVVVVDGGHRPPALPADPRVRIHTLSRPCGAMGVLRNIGVRSSASRWIAFLDDSLTWRSDHLERALARHRHGAELTTSRVDAAGHGDVIESSSLVVARRRGVRFDREPSGAAGTRGDTRGLVRRLSKRLYVEAVAETTVLSSPSEDERRPPNPS
jgi:glycosyltransferase involved in cell wall biosynthesis